MGLKWTVVRSSNPWGTNDVNVAVDPGAGEPLSDILAKDENVFIDPYHMRRFRAAVFLPHFPQQLTFYELHSMHLPIFIPGCAWLYRLYHQRSWALFYDSKGRKAGGGRGHLMKPPLLNENALLFDDTFAHWVVLYERRYALDLPGVHTFSSF